MAESSHNGPPNPTAIEVRILRQDRPGQASYWERHRVAYENDMNVISVLQRVATQATTVDGKKVAPVHSKEDIVKAVKAFVRNCDPEAVTELGSPDKVEFFSEYRQHNVLFRQWKLIWKRRYKGYPFMLDETYVVWHDEYGFLVGVGLFWCGVPVCSGLSGDPGLQLRILAGLD